MTQDKHYRIKVTLVSLNFAPEPTGIAPYAAGLVGALKETNDIDVSVLTTQPHYPQWKRQIGYNQWKRTERSQDGTKIRRYKHYVPRKPTVAKRFISELTFAVRSLCTDWDRPDLIVTISPSLVASLSSVLKARLLGTPLIVWAQDLYAVGLAERGSRLEKIESKLIGVLERWLYNNATFVVAIHERFKSTLTSVYGVTPNRVHVVRNWSHIPRVPLSNRARIRSQLNWTDYYVIMHTGAQGTKQGLLDLLPLAEAVSKSLPQVRWVLIGHGSDHERLKIATEALEYIQLIPPLEEREYVNYLAAADAFLLTEAPGTSEAAVPSKLTTYFSAYSPVIAILEPDSISADEIQRSSAGVVVRRDIESVISSIDKLINDQALSHALAQNGVEFASRVLSQKGSTERFAELIRLATRSHSNSYKSNLASTYNENCEHESDRGDGIAP